MGGGILGAFISLRRGNNNKKIIGREFKTRFRALRQRLNTSLNDRWVLPTGVCIYPNDGVSRFYLDLREKQKKTLPLPDAIHVCIRLRLFKTIFSPINTRPVAFKCNISAIGSGIALAVIGILHFRRFRHSPAFWPFCDHCTATGFLISSLSVSRPVAPTNRFRHLPIPPHIGPFDYTYTSRIFYIIVNVVLITQMFNAVSPSPAPGKGGNW